MTLAQLITALQAYQATVSGDPVAKVNNDGTWEAVQKVELDPDSNTILLDVNLPQ